MNAVVDDKPIDVAIVGCGVTGFFSAMALARQGFEVVVFSRGDILTGFSLPMDPVQIQQLALPDQDVPSNGVLLRQAWIDYALDLGITFETFSEMTELCQEDGHLVLTSRSIVDGDLYEDRALAVLLATGRGNLKGLEPAGRPLTSSLVAENSAGPLCFYGQSQTTLTELVRIMNQRLEDASDEPIYWAFPQARMPVPPASILEELSRLMFAWGHLRLLPDTLASHYFQKGDQDWLSFSVGARAVGEHMLQAQHLAFRSESVIVQWDGEPTAAWLKDLGILVHEVDGEAYPLVDEQRMTSLANVYLGGSLLEGQYYQTNFQEHGDLLECYHQGDLSAALQDALRLAETIANSLQRPLPKLKKKPKLKKPKAPEKSKVVEESKPPLQDPLAGGTAPCLVLLDPDGHKSFPLTGKAVTIGTKGTNILFPESDLLSMVHASVRQHDGRFLLKDESSSTGTFLKLPPGRETVIQAGDLVRLGSQFLLFGEEDGRFSLRHYDDKGEERGIYEITTRSLVLGQKGDIALGDHDPAIALRHLTLRISENSIFVRDLFSGDGSYLRIMGEALLRDWDAFMLGNKLFRIHLSEVSQSLPEQLPQVSIEGEGGPYFMLPGETLSQLVRRRQLKLEPTTPVKVNGHQEPIGKEERQLIAELYGRRKGIRLPGYLICEGQVVLA